MKSTQVLIGAVIATFGAAAHAQSTVTLYGILDNGVMYQSNVAGGKRVSMDSLGGINGSRWGMTGAEDLGGGLKAIFTLESGINLNSGSLAQGGTAFGRQAFVGATSASLGSLTFGRQYDMIFYFPEPITVSGMVGSILFAHPGDLDNTANSVRVNNAVRYMSPSYRGFSFGAEYSVGGVAGNTTANSGYSIGASYIGGAASIGAAFEYFKNPTSSTPGQGFFTNNANGSSVLAGVLNKGYASASAYQAAVIAANYTVGPVTVAISGSNIQYANLGGTLAGQTARFNNAEAGIKYAYSPFLFFNLGYDYLIGKGVSTTAGGTIGNQHFHQVSFLADYFLSKRTDVYAAVGWQKASGTSSTGTPAVANFTNQGDSSSNRQFVARLDFRHKF
ncbi:porin [Caballeronia temeraria]